MAKETDNVMNFAKIKVSPLLRLLFLSAYGFRQSFACLSTGVGSSCYCSNGQFCESCPTNLIAYGGQYSPPLLNGYATPAIRSQPSINQNKAISGVYARLGASDDLTDIRGNSISYDTRTTFVQQPPFQPLQGDASLNANAETQRQHSLSQLDDHRTNEYKATATKDEGTLERYSADVALPPTALAPINRQRSSLRQIHLEPRKEYIGHNDGMQAIRQRDTNKEPKGWLSSTFTPLVYRSSGLHGRQENRLENLPSELETVHVIGNRHSKVREMPDVSVSTIDSSIKNSWSDSRITKKPMPNDGSIEESKLGDSQSQSYYSEEQTSSEADVYNDHLSKNDANSALTELDMWPPASDLRPSDQHSSITLPDRHEQRTSATDIAVSTYYPSKYTESQLVRRGSNAMHHNGQTSSTYRQEDLASGTLDQHASTFRQLFSVADDSISPQEVPLSEKHGNGREATKASTSEPDYQAYSNYNREASDSGSSSKQAPAYFRGPVVKFTLGTSTSRQIAPNSDMNKEHLRANHSFSTNKLDNTSSPYQEKLLYSWRTKKQKSKYGEEISGAAMAGASDQIRRLIPSLSPHLEPSNSIASRAGSLKVGHLIFTVNKSNDTYAMNHEQLHSSSSNQKAAVSRQRPSTSDRSNSYSLATFPNLLKSDHSNKEINHEQPTVSHHHGPDTVIDLMPTKAFVEHDEDNIVNRQMNLSSAISETSYKNSSIFSSKLSSTFPQQLPVSANPLEATSTSLGGRRLTETVHETIAYTEQSNASSFTTQSNTSFSHEEQTSAIATSDPYSSTFHQNLSTTVLPSFSREKSTAATRQAMNLVQNSTLRSDLALSRKNENRIFPGNDSLPIDMSEDEIIAKRLSELDQRMDQTTSKMEAFAVFGVQQSKRKDDSKEQLYSATNSKVHLVGSQIKESAHTTIEELGNNRVQESNDEQTQIEVQASHITAETNLYHEPMTLKTTVESDQHKRVALSAIRTTTSATSSTTTATLPKVIENYGTLLRRAQKERKNPSPYITYYNQVCTGISIGMSHGETITSAASKCVTFGCEAMNAKSVGNGQFEVVFLNKVDGRRPTTGIYCVSGIVVNDEDNDKSGTHGKKLIIRPLEAKLARAIRDIGFDDVIWEERLAQAESHPHGSHRRWHQIILSNRFVTSEPKSEN
ncbi:hypothetical protein Tcan_08831 [Toxocara canis]|uniref:Uncharacterized protein n=1 Tax=Toxocara canis TaxID=6265 RepID=A0A0B2USR3_TOXCA|nr:hypothetical protein Tcan_08831 [Toxocara canis]